jgi:hypothetical protein
MIGVGISGGLALMDKLIKKRFELKNDRKVSRERIVKK